MENGPFINESSQDASGVALNATNQREYVYTPFNNVVIATFVSMLVTSSTIGCLGNIMVLYLKWKQYQAQNQKPRRALERQIANYFICSLAISDVYAAVVPCPLLAIQKSTDLFQTRAGCKTVRFFQILAPVLTVTNLIVIGTERYLGIFYPLRSPTKKTAKRLLVAAWLVSIASTAVSIGPVELTPYNLGSDQYTFKCKAITTSTAWRITLMMLMLLLYILPSLLLVYSCVAITRFLRQRERRKHPIPGNADDVAKSKAEARNLRTAKMFVTVILTFVLPYALFNTHMVVYVVLKRDMGVVFDFIIPLYSAVLSLSNCAINPFIYINGSADLKKHFKKHILQKLPWKRQAEKERNVANRNPQEDHKQTSSGSNPTQESHHGVKDAATLRTQCSNDSVNAIKGIKNLGYGNAITIDINPQGDHPQASYGSNRHRDPITTIL